jgi:hypothetical protein
VEGSAAGGVVGQHRAVAMLGEPLELSQPGAAQEPRAAARIFRSRAWSPGVAAGDLAVAGADVGGGARDGAERSRGVSGLPAGGGCRIEHAFSTFVVVG